MSVCHWTPNSLSAHNFTKLTQLKAYNSIYKYDFICLSETYLDSSTPDNLIEIEGYKLIRADHPDTSKGVEFAITRKSLFLSELLVHLILKKLFF